MKKLVLLSLIVFFHQLSFSQNFDLIVTKNGDSIACRINSITDTHIYFEMISYKKWIQTNIIITKVEEYK